MPPTQTSPNTSKTHGRSEVLFIYYHCYILLHSYKATEIQINACVVRDLLQSRIIKYTINICINHAKDTWHFKQIPKL